MVSGVIVRREAKVMTDKSSPIRERELSFRESLSELFYLREVSDAGFCGSN